jgi:anti-anti-sigma regulatory factor
MKTSDWNVFAFPCTTDMVSRRALRKDLLSALRPSGAAVIVDFSECHSLNHEDLDLLLECMAKVAGRDTRMVFVAGSRENRVIFELTRISSLVPVFASLPEALADPKHGGQMTQAANRSPIGSA